MTTDRTGATALFWRSLPFIIASGCLIAVLSFGPRSIMGLFLAPITEDRGWTREIFGLSIAIQNLLWGIGQPFAGMIADRYGTARVLAVGGVIYALGLFMMAWAPEPVFLHLSAGILVGIGLSAASFSIVLAAFGRAVSDAKRSLAFGVGTAAGSLGQFVFGFLGQGLIDHFGWSMALIIMGVMMLAIVVLAIPLQGRSEVGAQADAVVESSLGATLAEAFGHKSYVLLVLGFFVCGFHVAFIAVHLPPYLTDKGIDATWGASAIAIIGLFNVAGSLISGVIGGRYSKAYFLSLIYFGRGIAITIFILMPITPVTVVVFAAVMGFLWLSTVPPTSGLVAAMFGPRYMATLFGIVFFSHQIGAFLGVWLGGRLYDTTGTYDVVWWLGVALSVFAALVHLPIKDTPAPSLQPVRQG
ncbi:MAG: MFS transporter [Hyphomicrobiales bacterium]|nr:MAG: MFS transporter [Hyphomicrobiales bacterium]